MLTFPLGKTGGLIEAAASGYEYGGRRAQFPLGKTGGLIEASGADERSDVARASLYHVSAG